MGYSYEEYLRARLERETNLVEQTGGRLRFALAYPNAYRVGMSNLGIHIIYELLNSRVDTACERFFLSNFEPYQVSLKKYTFFLFVFRNIA